MDTRLFGRARMPRVCGQRRNTARDRWSRPQGGGHLKYPRECWSSTGPMEIWVERVMHTGLRRRLGSPFVAALVEEDAGLANSYHPTLSFRRSRDAHASHRQRDCCKGTQEWNGERSRCRHGRRLASRVLPDVLCYDHADAFRFHVRCSERTPPGGTLRPGCGYHPQRLPCFRGG